MPELPPSSKSALPSLDAEPTEAQLKAAAGTFALLSRHLYAVDDPHVVTMVDQIFEHLAPDGTLAPDPPPADTA